jgi:outer membrane protein assembly factor BamB
MVWKEYRGTKEKQGHPSIDGVVGPVSIDRSGPLWKVEGSTGAGFVSSAAVTSSGVVIVGDLEGHFYAFEIESGAMLWSTAQVLGEYLSSSPTLSDDESTVLISSYAASTSSAVFYSIDVESGVILTTQTIPDMPGGNGTSAFSSFSLYPLSLDPPKVLAITAYGDKIFALHTTDFYDGAGQHFHPGWQSWNFSGAFNTSYTSSPDSDVNIQSTPAISGDYAYFATPAGDVIALDCRTGIEQWRYYVGGYIGSSPVLDPKNQRLYITNTQGIHALTLESGVSTLNRLLVSFATSTTISSAALSTDAETLYFATSDGTLYALDVEATFFPLLMSRSIHIATARRLVAGGTMHVKWLLPLGDSVQLSSPVVDSDDNVYVGTAGGKICAVNSTGHLMWSHQTTGAVYGSASLPGNNTMVIGTQDGLYAFYAAPAPVAAPDPPVDYQGQTDFPEGGLWAIMAVCLSFLFVVCTWLVYSTEKERKMKIAAERMQRESHNLEKVHRASSGNSGLRSVFSSQSSSVSADEMMSIDSASYDWGLPGGRGSTARGRSSQQSGSLDPGTKEVTTGKWSTSNNNNNRTNSRSLPPVRVPRARTISSLSTNTAMVKDNPDRPPRHHAAAVIPASVAEGSSGGSSSGDSETGSTSGGGGGVYGLFAMLFGRKSPPKDHQQQQQPQPLEEVQINAGSSPSSSPPHGKKRGGDGATAVVQRSFRDSADGTAMFSRKASPAASVMMQEQAEEGEREGGIVVVTRNNTDISLPSSSELMQQSRGAHFPTTTTTTTTESQPEQEHQERTMKTAPKRHRKAQWVSTLVPDSTQTSIASSSHHDSRQQEQEQEQPPPPARLPARNPRSIGSGSTEVPVPFKPRRYPPARYSESVYRSDISTSSAPMTAAAAAIADHGLPSSGYYVSSSEHNEGDDSGNSESGGEDDIYWQKPRAPYSLPTGSGSIYGLGGSSGPLDSMELRKMGVLAAAAAAGGTNARASVSSSGSSGGSQSHHGSREEEEQEEEGGAMSVEMREVTDTVLVQSLTASVAHSQYSDVLTSAEVGSVTSSMFENAVTRKLTSMRQAEEALLALSRDSSSTAGGASSMSTTYIYSPSVGGLSAADTIPMTPLSNSNAPSLFPLDVGGQAVLLREEEDDGQQPGPPHDEPDTPELRSRGMVPSPSLGLAVAAAGGDGGSGPSLRSPTRLGQTKVLSLQMPASQELRRGGGGDGGGETEQQQQQQQYGYPYPNPNPHFPRHDPAAEKERERVGPHESCASSISSWASLPSCPPPDPPSIASTGAAAAAGSVGEMADDGEQEKGSVSSPDTAYFG